MLRFVPLFEPVAGAILAHQDKAALRHADETSLARARASRGRPVEPRLAVTSVSSDAVYFHIDPSRSAEAAEKLFAAALLHTVIVCDRYSAYKRLARLRGGLVTLAFCWSHQRRDFIECAAGPGQPDGMVPGMDRADRVDLPPERGAAGALRRRA